MINVKYKGNRYKIYATGKIKCLDECSPMDKLFLDALVQELKIQYNRPECGFLVRNIAHFLPKHGVEVISYRDYEMENAPSGRVY